MNREIYLDNIGKVTLKESKRSRYLRLRVDPKEGIVAIVPKGISEKILIPFLQEKKAWLEKSLRKQEKLKSQFTIFTHRGNYRTRFHTLFLRPHKKNTVKSAVGENKIIILYPEDAEVTDERIQIVIRRAVLEAWRVEAKRILPARVKELADQYHFKYRKLTVKNAKTRWGSCSAENNINLNLQLMRLPDELIDYVIIHELTHTIHKHHQARFWQTLERIFPNARQLDKALNSYHLEYW
jgi:predicted metal-dependent hydrolase